MNLPQGVPRAALEAARLAPSAHNSQPARFRPDDESIALGWDSRRVLPAGDPQRHYLFAGLGASAESLRLGAALTGRRATITWNLVASETSAASVDLSGDAPEPADAELAAAVGARQTTRLPFRSDSVATDLLGDLCSEAEAMGCRLAVVEGAKAMSEFAGLVAEGTARNLDDPQVYAELFEWLRLRRSHPNHDRDGLSAAALSLGRLQTLVGPVGMTPSAMRLLGHARLLGVLAGTQRRLARRAPAACLLIAPSGSAGDRFTGGRAMLRVWIRATAMGLRVHPMTAAMDHTETRHALAALFGVGPDAPMVVCFRTGYGPTGPRSPRLPLDELLQH